MIDLRDRTEAGALVTVVVVALLAHLPALGGGFVWLDHAHVEEGLALARPDQWSALFTNGFAGTGYYRPLVSLSLSVEAMLGGAPALFHATTLGWHAAASVMVVRAAAAIGLPFEARLAAGLIFSVHPITSVVASAIAFRSEAMATVALLALVVFHVRGRPSAAALALLLGALCKETALVLAPLFALAIEGERRFRQNPGMTSHRVLLSEAVALLLALGLRFFFAPGWRATYAALSPSEALGTRLSSLAKSATAFVPIGIWDHGLCDAFPVALVSDPRALAGAIVAAFVIWLAWKRPPPAVFFALALLPSLQIVPVMRWWSPHYLYVPLAFGAMLAGQALCAAVARPNVVAAAAAVILGTQTFHDDQRFENDARLWTREVALEPTCREGQFYVAETLREQRRYSEAVAHYERATSPTPGVLSFVDLQAAEANLGVARLAQGRPDAAATAFRRAISMTTAQRERRLLTCNLGAALLLSGDADGARRVVHAETAREEPLEPCRWVDERARSLAMQRDASAGAPASAHTKSR